MPSPFPGMNPYLESPAVWRDFHQRMVVALAAALTAGVRPRYFVKIEESVHVRDAGDPDDASLYVADLAIKPAANGHPGARPGGGGGVAVATAAPARVRLPAYRGRKRVPYLAVTDTESREVVTVLELLGPSNKKPGPDREAFLAKRKELLASAASYVELDLLRGHPRLPVADLPACDYYAIVSRPAVRPDADAWPIPSAGSCRSSRSRCGRVSRSRSSPCSRPWTGCTTRPGTPTTCAADCRTRRCRPMTRNG